MIQPKSGKVQYQNKLELLFNMKYIKGNNFLVCICVSIPSI